MIQKVIAAGTAAVHRGLRLCGSYNGRAIHAPAAHRRFLTHVYNNAK